MPQSRRDNALLLAGILSQAGQSAGGGQGASSIFQMLIQDMLNQRSNERIIDRQMQQQAAIEERLLGQQNIADQMRQRAAAAAAQREAEQNQIKRFDEAANLFADVRRGDEGGQGRTAIRARMNAGDPIATDIYRSGSTRATMDPSLSADQGLTGGTVRQSARGLPPPFRTPGEQELQTLQTPGLIQARAGAAGAVSAAQAEGAGTGRFAPETPAKPTQAQIDAAARVPLLRAADKQAAEIEATGAPVIRSNLPDILNFFRGEQGQIYRNAVRTVGITSLKTLFPGQLSDQEREAGLALIVPDIGDAPEMITTKATRRHNLVQLVERIASGEPIDITFEELVNEMGGGTPEAETSTDPFVEEARRRGLRIPGGGG